MANNTREIRRRIKSINSTRKITRAMEMVSAAKMRRAVAAVLAIRPYAHSAWSVLTNLARAFEQYGGHGMLEVREVKSILMIVVSSNRGLCGAFNTNIARKIRYELDHPERLKMNRIGNKKIESTVKDGELKVDYITIGRKAAEIIARVDGSDAHVIASFAHLTYQPKAEEVRPLAKLVMDEYLKKNYDKVVIVYTDYVSAINQQTKIRQVLPISKVDIEKQIAEIDQHAKEYGLVGPKVEYKIEPSPREVLEFIFPRLIEMQIFHAIEESNASKESARMIAMQNATDAAGDMAHSFTLAYNQIRQQKITQEIAEISAGAAAIES
ncbi:MAG: ATP synthase F1 subunit gamma [Candidatus Pacebacteria bacterium]|nr:ATP synthase F1 subunit gamma [Candidatus Paceibacterota bacterium]MDR3583044.1 ATP synthase F1 subunit gamma [Candidatus Paceibacterota bacterium]